MTIFKKFGRGKEKTASGLVQTAAADPFGLLETYSPLAGPDWELYKTLREAVPIIDAAIFKLVRLTCGFEVECDDKRAKAALDKFVQEVAVGGNQRGLYAFVAGYLEELLTQGTAVGEIVLNAGGRIGALYNAPIRDLSFRRGEDGISAELFVQEGFEFKPLSYPNLIVFSVLNPEAGGLTGNSLLKGLPFVSSVLLKILTATKANWERVGNVRFAVTYRPNNDAMDKAFAKERALQVAREWGETMRAGNTVRDFVAAGDVQIKVIGAENQIPDSEVPVRQLLEQIVAKTGLPPFMLGLSWSSTERMSSQQADTLTSELEAYRSVLTPVISKICDLYLKLEGFDCSVSVLWDDISLQDSVELARARLLNAQAEKIENENERRKADDGKKEY